MDEDVLLPIGVARYQVVGLGGEGHEAAIGAHGGILTFLLTLQAIARDADPRGLSRPPVMEEDVRGAVGVAWHEVVSPRLEGQVAAVGTYRSSAASVVGLLAGARDAHPFRFAGFPVVDEDVWCSVRVTGNEILGIGFKSHEASSGIQSGEVAVPFGLDPGARNTGPDQDDDLWGGAGGAAPTGGQCKQGARRQQNGPTEAPAKWSRSHRHGTKKFTTWKRSSAVRSEKAVGSV